jgi:hypothetical protein
MKKLFFTVLIGAAIQMIVRRLAGEAEPTIREVCDRMEARTPTWFPIKRNTLDIEVLKTQNAELRRRLDAVEAPSE